MLEMRSATALVVLGIMVSWRAGASDTFSFKKITIDIGGFSVFSDGEVDHIQATWPGVHGMTGMHTINDGAAGTIATKAIGNDPNLHTQSYAGTVTAGTVYRHCYRAYLSVQCSSAANGVGSGEVCAPPAACPDLNGNLICDSQEPVDKDPNEDTCPGGAPCSSPILINVGAGAWRIGGLDDVVAFDMNADGSLDHLTWPERDSTLSFLAVDRNLNGMVDSGAELFGNWTPLARGGTAANGFEALKEFDSNGDGVVDNRDVQWPDLLLWHDSNHDGLSQAVELTRLSVSGVLALETAYHWTGRRDATGNVFAFQGRANVHGRPKAMYDVYFRGAS